MHKIKTVFLIRNIAPGDYGGGERYQVELAKVLKKNGYVPIIFTASNRLIKEAKENEIKVVRAPFFKQQNWSSWRNLLLPIYYVWQMRLKHWYKTQIKKYDPCVLNIQSRDELIGATLAGLSCKKRVIWTDHADFRTWSLVNVDKKLKNQIGKWILRCARKVYRIVMINDHEKKSLEGLIKPTKLDNLLVIQNGVTDEYSNYNSVQPKKNSFYYIGRIVKDKGVIELTKAFKKVLGKHSDVTLSIYGDGDELETCKKMAEDETGIRFYGYVDRPLGIVAEHETFIFPSYHEGLSLALLEAAMMKKTIIATDIDGNREVVQDGVSGIMVPVKDVRKLTEAIEEIIEDRKKAKKMAENVRKKYEKEFNLEKIFVEKMSPLYNIEKE